MSHVNAEKIAATVNGAGMTKMMAPTTGKLGMAPMMGGMGPMMSEGMGSMMGGMGPMMSEGMGPMMGGMGPMMGGMGSMMKSPGVVASAGSSAGKSVIRKVFTHPLVLFGLGVVAGYYVYKYRKSIISASDEAE